MMMSCIIGVRKPHVCTRQWANLSYAPVPSQMGQIHAKAAFRERIQQFLPYRESSRQIFLMGREKV